LCPKATPSTISTPSANANAEARWKEGKGGEGEERAIGAIATCTTSDLLLKHPNETLATYVRRQMKYLKHASETLAKHLKTDEKSLQNICNIHIKHLQYMCETYVTSK
jgi:hypothetical protein